jgi:O-antigen/teichoic acid export membrane protein
MDAAVTTDRAGASRPGRAVSGERAGRGSRLGARLAVLGGIAAQLSQALGSLVLQVIAARLLGADGLGAFAVLYGVIIMATGVCTGFVGDSLTVLDRGRRDIRAALQNWLLVLSLAGAVVAYAIAVIGGFLTAGPALVFAGATAVFLIEDALRRLLMANLRFWRIVAVDLTSLAGSLATLVVVAVTGGEIGLGTLMLSLLVGQSVAILAAVLQLPAGERWLASPARGAWGAVAGYGSWRAAQQFLRPGMLTAMRLLVVGVVGLATMGALEAARIYTAPMLLVVSGASSFLFASYAATGSHQSQELLRRADRGVLGLFGGTVAMSLVAVAAIGFAGPLLVGDSIQLTVTAVVGWCAYAVSVAAVTPYGALAAVRRRQAAVLGLRTADSVLSLTAVAALLLAGGDPTFVPLVLAGCSLAGGIAIRQLLLVRGRGGRQ